MKKTIFRITALVLMLVLLSGCLAGCLELPERRRGNSADTEPSETTEPAEEATAGSDFEDAEPVYAQVTVTADTLSVRTGPGTQYEMLSELKRGDVVFISATTLVNGTAWGKTGTGWICLDYVQFNNASQEEIDQAMAKQLVGSWYAEIAFGETDSSVRVFTFQPDGTFTHSIYTFLNNNPNDFREHNDDFCSGSYRVENEQLIMSFTFFFWEPITIPLGGREWGVNDTAYFDMSIGSRQLKLTELTMSTLNRGGIEDIKKIIENTEFEETAQDRALKNQLIGSWYLDISTESGLSFRTFTFMEDGSFTHAVYLFSNADSDYFIESNDASCGGSYRVRSNCLILEINSAISEDIEIPLSDLTLKKGDPAYLNLYINGSSLDLYDYTVTTFTKGSLEDLIALVSQLRPVQPEVPSVGTTDPRLLGNWYSFYEIDYEAKAVTTNRNLTFHSDGSYTGSVGGSRYLYDPDTGELYYDIEQAGVGGYDFSGNYSFDGSTLLLNMTYCEFDAEPLGVETYTVTFSGDTMLLNNGKRTDTFYPISWEEIGPYFFQ